MRGFQHSGAAIPAGHRFPLKGDSHVDKTQLLAIRFGKTLRFTPQKTKESEPAERRRLGRERSPKQQASVQRSITETGNLDPPVHGNWNPGAGSHGRRPQS